jgi:two-component system, OmpR family, manganese sensing response regulator
MNILLVDDEIELTNPLSRVLRQEGYGVDVATDGLTGKRLATQQHYDLYILDWVLPVVTGIEICQGLRQTGNTKPVLFLTAQDTLDDRVRGLDAGADDYLVKPFELRELLARVRALLRRGQSGEFEHGGGVDHAVWATPHRPEPQLQVGQLTLDIASQLAYLAGQTIELSEKEAYLLAYLMQHAGQLVTHQQIHEHLWGNSPHTPNSNVLAALMRLLRRKMSISGQPELIYTIYGKGYQLNSTDQDTLGNLD